MPPSDDFKDFCLAIDGALHLLFSEFERLPQHPIAPPSGWPALRSAARVVAENLMLCSDVPKAIHGLIEDQATLRYIVTLINALSDQVHLHLYGSAYRTAGHQWRNLPGSPVAHFLVAVCEYTAQLSL